MFEFINNLLPKSCWHLCSISTNCNYETRHRRLFRISTSRTNIYKRNISVSGPKIWDSIPHELQVENNIRIFKRKLSLYFIDKYSNHWSYILNQWRTFDSCGVLKVFGCTDWFFSYMYIAPYIADTIEKAQIRFVMFHQRCCYIIWSSS